MRIEKVCIGSAIDNSSMFEANALGVWVIDYSIDVELTLGSGTSWTDDFLESINKDYEHIADSPEFQYLRRIASENSQEYKEQKEVVAVGSR